MSTTNDAPDTVVASAEEEPREPCPTPLAWTQVLALFRAESRQHEVAVGNRLASAWSWGDPDRSAIVLVGTATTTPALLALVAHLLRDEFHVVVLDSPDSSRPDGRARRSLADHAADLVAAADVCGHSRFHVVGCGWGSGVAVQALADHAERVESAVLYDGLARVRYSLAEQLAVRVAAWMPGRLGSLVGAKTLLEQTHRRWFPPFDHSRWEFLAEETGRLPLRVVGNRLRALAGTDLRERLPEIEQPVLVVRAEGEGRMAASRAEELAEGLPNGRVERMHNTGQLPFLTHPHRVAKTVRTFVEGLGTS